MTPTVAAAVQQLIDPGAYALAGWLFVRGVAVVGLVAFVSLGVQARGLLGEGGLVPVRPCRGRQLRRRLLTAPSVLHRWGSERAVRTVVLAGAVACVLALVDVATVPALLLAYLAYLSLVNVGRPFLSYQWDVLLLEALLVAAVVAASWPPDPWALALAWVLAARFMLMSGLAKLRSGDRTWRDGTAVWHHLETQPLPTPLAWWARRLPRPLLRATTYAVLVIEVGAAVGLLAPWPLRAVPVVLLVLLQIGIRATGSFGFFNLLAVILLIPLVPDSVWEPIAGGLAPASGPGGGAGVVAIVAGAYLVLQLAELAAVTDLRQRIRALLRPVAGWRLTSPYGLFASMTTTRPELSVEARDAAGGWHAYPFRAKPGDPRRRPRVPAPHMPRLDWQLWFAALGAPGSPRWLDRLVDGLLARRSAVLGLFAGDPLDGEAPTAVRIVRYQYRFATPEQRRERGTWWNRDHAGVVLRHDRTGSRG